MIAESRHERIELDDRCGIHHEHGIAITEHLMHAAHSGVFRRDLGGFGDGSGGRSAPGEADDGADRPARCCRVDHGPIAGDDASALECVDPCGRSGRREMDLLGQLAERQPTIGLESFDDLPIDVVHWSLSDR